MYIPTMFFGSDGEFTATGGDINTFVSGGILYKSHLFTDITELQSFNVLNGYNTISVLAIGGGGGKSNTVFGSPRYYGGAGGSGQLIYSQSLTFTKGNYSIDIGNAGADISSASGENGENTIITGSNINIIAYGGGGGGYVNFNGKNGGSGGGAGPSFTGRTPGKSIYGEFGSDGGSGSAILGGTQYLGGGGGGTDTNATTRTGGKALYFSSRYGNDIPYGFGGTINHDAAGYPAGFQSTKGNGSSTFSFFAQSGVVVLSYAVETAVSSSCYLYRLDGVNSQTIVYTDCTNTVIELPVTSSSVEICRKADTPIYKLESSNYRLLDWTVQVNYLGPC